MVLIIVVLIVMVMVAVVIVMAVRAPDASAAPEAIATGVPGTGDPDRLRAMRGVAGEAQSASRCIPYTHTRMHTSL